MTLRERDASCRSLICLLFSLQGRRTTIELRNESSVTGTVILVDSDMNIHLTDATFRTVGGQESRFEQFFIRGVNIRFVHIPDDIDMRAAIWSQVDIVKKAETVHKAKPRLTKEEKKKKQKDKVQQKYEEMKRKLGM